MKKKMKKNVLSIVRSIRKGKEKEFSSCGQWDINSKTYTPLEYAARLMRKKGVDITIKISDNTFNPSYLNGYIVFYRYCYVKIN